jgi:hypothetical protein
MQRLVKKVSSTERTAANAGRAKGAKRFIASPVPIIMPLLKGLAILPDICRIPDGFEVRIVKHISPSRMLELENRMRKSEAH